MLETEITVIVEVVDPDTTRGKSMVPCYVCAAPIPVGSHPLCALCQDIQGERERAYREEQEQARRPF